MLSPSTNRIRHDALGVGDVSVRCACPAKGTLIIVSLDYFMKLGADAALTMAESRCPKCTARKKGGNRA